MTSSKKSIRFVVQCKTTCLFLSNFTPCRASIEITPVQALAFQCESVTQARSVITGMHALFGSFDFQPVRVEV